MSRFLTAAITTAILAVAPASAWASRQPVDLETFDSAPAGVIQPGQVLKLEHFQIQTALGTTATIKPVMQQDELASGLALGAVDNAGPASIHVSFAQPRRSVTFTVVLPPAASTLKSVAALYGPGETQRQALTIQHSLAGHRVRLTLSEPAGGSFERLSLQLQRGAYIDGVEMTSPVNADATVIDFDELPSAPLQGATDQGHYIVLANAGIPAIAPSSEPETSGKVLTSHASNGNDVVVFYRNSRRMLELTVVPDPSGEPARIEFLSAGHFNVLHAVDVDPKAGPQRLSYVAEGANSLQGVRWTGGKLRIDDVTLQPE